MKKHSLFKVLLMVLLLVVVLSYVFVGRDGAVSYLALGDLGVNYVQTFYYFFDTLVFVLVVGGFYGILNKTGAYKKLLDNIVTKVKGKSKKFIFAIVVVFAVVSALTGINLQLIIFVPFVISIILLLGYDKLVAISSTVVAALVGLVGGLVITFRDPSSYYSYASTTINKFVGIDANANLFPKILLLVLAIGLLIFYINKHIASVEAKKVKYELNDSTDILITEVKGNYKNIKTWPLITMLSLILVLLILGLVPWSTLFGTTAFTDFHTWLTGLSIGGFSVYKNIISANFAALGDWASVGSYMMPVIMLLFFAIIIKFVYKIKFDDAIDGFVDGAKKMLPVGFLMILAYTVLVCAYNNGFMETIISKCDSSNMVVASLLSMLGSLFNVDLYYTASGVLSPIISNVTADGTLMILALAFQSMYGLVMIIGPTSLILVFALTYLDVPYTTWVKYVWRFVLELFILIFVILLIVSLM